MGFTLANVKQMAVDFLHRDNLGTQLDTALVLGHRELQKAGDFTCQDKTGEILTVDAQDGTADLPDDFKKPQSLWRISEDGKRIHRIQPSSKAEVDAIEQTRHELHETGRGALVELRWFIFGNSIHLYPWNATDPDATAFRVQLDYWAFLDVPTSNGSDWFTTNGPLALALFACWYGSQHIWDDARASEFEQKAMAAAASLMRFDMESTVGPARAYRPPLNVPGRRRL